MKSFITFLKENLKAEEQQLSSLGRGDRAQLSATTHWAKQIAKINNPDFETQNRNFEADTLKTLSDVVLQNREAIKTKQRSRQPTSISVPHQKSGHVWQINTSDPSVAGLDDITIGTSSGSHRPIKIEVKSPKASLTSSTLKTQNDSITDISPESDVGRAVLSAYNVNHDQMVRILKVERRKRNLARKLGDQQREKARSEGRSKEEIEKIKVPGESKSRYFYVEKKQDETHHPIISAYERALHTKGIGVITITDGKGNFRHFSTNPDHPERLSKYIDRAHVDWRDNRLQLKISTVGADVKPTSRQGEITRQTRQETQALTWLSKLNRDGKPIGLSPQEILDMHKNA